MPKQTMKYRDGKFYLRSESDLGILWMQRVAMGWEAIRDGNLVRELEQEFQNRFPDDKIIPVASTTK